MPLDTTVRADAPTTAPSPSNSYHPSVTLAGYNQIQTGMSYEEVVRILGSEGVEGARSESATLQIVIYQWKVERPIGFLTVTFQNGKLASKGQTGLR